MNVRRPTRSQMTLSLSVLVAVVWAVVGAAPAAAQQQTETSAAQTSMRGIFFTLTMVYTLSLNAEAFEDPANYGQIQAGLQALVANASELDRHGGGLNPSYGYYKRSLAKDAQDALDRFSEGQYMGSRFVISKITENCVSCHVKLPKEQEFDLGDEFVNKRTIQKLKPEERIPIELAMRQFDDAVATYEELFADPKMTPENLALLAAYCGYMRVCIGALNDPQLAAGTLKTYAQRSDIPASFKNQVNGWIAALEAVDLDASAGNELAVSRDLIQNAEQNRKYPSDRSALVDYVVASTLLNRYMDSQPASDEDASEAFFLMGIAESRLTRSYWTSETEFLLAQSIRRAPKSDTAKQAYDFLAEYTVSAYAETSAREVSPELRADLEELRKLIEE